MKSANGSCRLDPTRLMRSLLEPTLDTCGLCSSTGAVLLHDEVSPGTSDTIELRQILTAVTGGIIGSDELPEMLCLACTNAAVTSYRFQQLCQNYSSIMSSLKTVVRNVESKELCHPEGALGLFLFFDGTQNKTIKMFEKIDNRKVAVSHLNRLLKKKTPTQLQCKYCRKSFRSKQHIRLHRRKCSAVLTQNTQYLSNESFTCSFDGCYKRCANRRSLSLHIVRTHEDKNYHCTFCNKMFGSPALVAEHVNSMHTYRECQVCNKGFLIRKLLWLHMKLHKEPSVDNDRIQCNNCGLRFTSKPRIKRHFNRCPALQRKYKPELFDKRFICPFTGCNKIFLKQDQLNLHIFRTHEEKKYPCTSCNKKFGSPALVVEHTKNMHTPRECEVCNKTFLVRKHLWHHMKLHQKLTTDEDLKAQCNHCGRTFSSKGNVEIHLRKCPAFMYQNPSESSDASLSCSITGCNKKYFKRQLLQLHFLRDHEDKNHPCTMCDKMFGSPVLVSEHFRAKHAYRECQVCNEGFNGNHSLSIHKQTHKPLNREKVVEKHEHIGDSSKQITIKKGVNEIICEMCGQKFLSMAQLRRHLVSKHGYPKKVSKKQKNHHYKCDLCHITTCSRNLTKAHMERVHFGKKGEIPCIVCGKLFHRPNELSRHMVKHTKERPELCIICGRNFVNKAALLYHTRLHTGERPFPCELCGKRFLSASRRGHHVRVMHCPRPQCPSCQKSFTTKMAMKKHVLKFHTGKELDNTPVKKSRKRSIPISNASIKS